MPVGSARRTALITGASAGIGAAFARVFAAHDFNLVLTARREDRLRALAKELTGEYGITAHVIAADLADPSAPGRIQQETDAQGIAVDALVNNAGYGVTGKFLASPWQVHARFIQVMMTAVCELSYRYLPAMVDRRSGWIINVASLAGLVPSTAGHTLYGPSKTFVIRFSQALALENRKYGVNVTALCPGFTLTEFHDVNQMRERVSRLPRVLWMDADPVAREGYEAVMRGRMVYVPGRVNRALAAGARLLPEWLTLRIVGTQRRRFRKD